jgi:hypothetical protein
MIWRSIVKTYKGHKVVQAEPMNLGDYNKLKGWTMPAGEDPAREGYVVHYGDGYVSWSPKQAFDDGYTEIESVA